MKTASLLLFSLALMQSPAPPDMAEIPTGEFWMGRVQMLLQDEHGYFLRPRIDDLPAHLVHLDRFYIDRYEVTHANYARFVQEANHRWPFHWAGGRIPEGLEPYPVYNVSWDDAAAYCQWAGKRLPTEAEWEKAARGGLDRKRYPWGDELQPGGAGAPKLAHYGVPNSPAPVGSFPPNDYGLYDMIGNVAEWVHDWYERTYYAVSPGVNPPGPDSGFYRAFRGSSWADPIEMGDFSEWRVYGVHFRNFLTPSHRASTVGFRCAQTP